MTEEERLALGERNRLVFENVANGVPKADVMAAFKLSQLEVDQKVAFVARKIMRYRYDRAEPPLPCSTEADIRFNRVALLETLRKLGPKYLSSELLLPTVQMQKLDTPAMVREAAQRAGVTVRQQ